MLLRLDLNIPIVGGTLRDDFRIKKSLSTLNFLRGNGAKTIIISHIESAETKSLNQFMNTCPNFSMSHFFKTISAKKLKTR